MNITINQLVGGAYGSGSVTGKTNWRLRVIRNGPITNQGSGDILITIIIGIIPYHLWSICTYCIPYHFLRSHTKEYMMGWYPRSKEWWLAGSLRVIWWQFITVRSLISSITSSTNFYFVLPRDSDNVNNPGSLPWGGCSLVHFSPVASLGSQDQRLRGGRSHHSPGSWGRLCGVSSAGAQKVMGFRQSEGGRRALGSPLSTRTTVVLTSDSLPQRHIPECHRLNLDPVLKCHDKQCKCSDKPLNTRDLRPVADHLRPMSSTEWSHHMLLRKALCYLRSQKVLQ